MKDLEVVHWATSFIMSRFLDSLKGGERMELYNCFSQRLAGFILMNGFPMHSIRIDAKNDGRNVYLFRDGELLRNIIKNYKK